VKLSKGRGIQFFKQPFFKRQGEYVANLYNASKEKFASVVRFGDSKKAGKKK